MEDGLEKDLRFGIAMAFAIVGSLVGIVVAVLGFYLKNKYFGMSGVIFFLACIVWGIYLLRCENGEPERKETIPASEAWNQDEPFERE